MQGNGSPQRTVDEARRMAVLHEFDVLDTPPERAFDRITALAARLLDVPMALVTMVDTDRVWFKSTIGVDVAQVTRDAGLCASAILQHEPWVIEDALDDPRACEHPLVTGALGMRFYAGVPLLVRDDTFLGTLCVMDVVPRCIAELDLQLLCDLAEVVVDELELRRQSRLSLELLQEADHRAERERERAKLEAGVARELAELDASRATFLRAVSHDLQTPLTAIRGTAELLVERGESLGEQRRTQLVAQLAGSTEVLQQLVTDLLDGERTRRRDGNVRRQRVDAVEIARSVASQAHLFEAPITVPSHTLEVDIDAVLLERILDNLLSNAWLHARSASTIDVELTEGRDGGLRVTVSDDGPGIPAPDRARILEAFERAESDRSTPGAGLGLSLVSQFAAMHGGSVLVGERPGGGASFTVDLPGAPRSVPDPQTPTPSD